MINTLSWHINSVFLLFLFPGAQGVHAGFALIVELIAMPRPGNEKGMLGGTEVRVLGSCVGGRVG